MNSDRRVPRDSLGVVPGPCLSAEASVEYNPNLRWRPGVAVYLDQFSAGNAGTTERATAEVEGAEDPGESALSCGSCDDHVPTRTSTR